MAGFGLTRKYTSYEVTFIRGCVVRLVRYAHHVSDCDIYGNANRRQLHCRVRQRQQYNGDIINLASSSLRRSSSSLQHGSGQINNDPALWQFITNFDGSVFRTSIIYHKSIVPFCDAWSHYALSSFLSEPSDLKCISTYQWISAPFLSLVKRNFLEKSHIETLELISKERLSIESFQRYSGLYTSHMRSHRSANRIILLRYQCNLVRILALGGSQTSAAAKISSSVYSGYIPTNRI